MNLRRVAIGVAVAVGFVTPLAIVGSAESATPTSGSASTVSLAAAGQWITFRGHVSGGARPVKVFWGTKASGLLNPVVGKSNTAGNFAINYRMMTMPYVTYSVVAPAYGRYAQWISPGITVKGHSQDVVLSLSGNTFTAQLTWTNLSAMTTANAAVAGRAITLQQRGTPGNWTTVAGPVSTNGGGTATFNVPGASGAYRAVAAQVNSGALNGLSAYVSFPVWTPGAKPNLSTYPGTFPDPAGRNLSPMPNSNNGAAQRYDWWPNNLFWDMEQGEGMKVQGCTAHCTFWSDYSTGSGRVNIRDGQIALESFATGTKPGWGFMSSTMQNPGFYTGRWEMRVHQAEWPTVGTVPYITQISLVPAGTSDAVRSPAKQIILGQWRGYNRNMLISVKNGTRTRSRVVTGVQWNRMDWNDLAVQINGRTVTFLLNGNVVGHTASGTAITGTKWVARIEMIDAQGKSMDRARGGIDWVRYFNLNRSWAKPLPASPAF